MRAIELYDEALASGDERLIEACLEHHAEDVELTASIMGVRVRSHGRDEMRAGIVSSMMRSDTRHRHVELNVVVDEPDRVVLRGTVLSLAGDTPLIAVPAEYDVRLRDGLISTMRVIELGAAHPPWTPLGPIPSFVGEIVAPWGEGGVLARLYDGRAQELFAPEELAESWEVGDPVLVFFDGPQPLGWYLPKRQVGVDLRALEELA
jgi:hypothetical protein